MKKKNAKEFVKTHKKEIAIAIAATVGGVVAFAITRKKPKFMEESVKIVETLGASNDIPKPEISIGTITELWYEDGSINAIVNDITVADLGKFGEELTKIDGVESNTIVTAMMGFIGKQEET